MLIYAEKCHICLLIILDNSKALQCICTWPVLQYMGFFWQRWLPGEYDKGSSPQCLREIKFFSEWTQHRWWQYTHQMNISQVESENIKCHWESNWTISFVSLWPILSRIEEWCDRRTKCEISIDQLNLTLRLSCHIVSLGKTLYSHYPSCNFFFFSSVSWPTLQHEFPPRVSTHS